MAPQEQRTWGLAAHLIGLAGMIFSAGFLGFVASLVVYLVVKDRGNFVRLHSANSLNVQIAALIGTVIGWGLVVTIILLPIGVLLLGAVWVWALVVHIMGAVKANNGELWDPPFAPKLIR